MTLAGRLLQTPLTHFQFKKSVFHIPHKMLQANSFNACEVKQEEIAQFTKRKQPDESLKERLW